MMEDKKQVLHFGFELIQSFHLVSIDLILMYKNVLIGTYVNMRY